MEQQSLPLSHSHSHLGFLGVIREADLEVSVLVPEFCLGMKKDYETKMNLNMLKYLLEWNPEPFTLENYL